MGLAKQERPTDSAVAALAHVVKLKPVVHEGNAPLLFLFYRNLKLATTTGSGRVFLRWSLFAVDELRNRYEETGTENSGVGSENGLSSPYKRRNENVETARCA